MIPPSRLGLECFEPENVGDMKKTSKELLARSQLLEKCNVKYTHIDLKNNL